MTAKDSPENQAEKNNKSGLAWIRLILKTLLAALGGLVALFGLSSLGGLAYLYFSAGYYAVGLSNVGDYEVLITKVAVDEEVLFEGSYALEPGRGRRADGTVRADRPDRPARIEFKARRPKSLELSLHDPELKEDKTVAYQLKDAKGLGCVYRVRYDNGQFLGAPDCE